MRRSFLRLVVRSVLATWAAGFVVLLVYATTQTWTEERARQDGVFLVHEMLDATPPGERADRLDALRPHFRVSYSLAPLDEVTRRTGRALRPGDHVRHRVSFRESWYYVAFTDGRGALAAGPEHPAIPVRAVPIGVVLAFVAVPVIAAFVALRVQRQVSHVERATDALASGELSARVDGQVAASELATRFNAMAERVESLIRSRDELVQAVSHELGSPLSRMRFHLELLERSVEDERDARLRAMARELDALDALVAELLTYVQSDTVPLERQAFDGAGCLGDLAELARLEVPDERGVVVELALPTDATVRADPRQFQRAVENLLRNAARYARGRVRLEMTRGEGGVRVAVHDDGPGIPDDVRDKVTAPFFRLEADRGRSTGGVGLGLAIVRRIVERHGGRVEIGTSPLGGARVTTTWP